MSGVNAFFALRWLARAEGLPARHGERERRLAALGRRVVRHPLAERHHRPEVVVPGPLRQVRRHALPVVPERRLPGGEHHEHEEDPDHGAGDPDGTAAEEPPRPPQPHPFGRRHTPRPLPRECRATRSLPRPLVALVVVVPLPVVVPLAVVVPLRVLVPAHVPLPAPVVVTAGAAGAAVVAVGAARVTVPLVGGAAALVAERLRGLVGVALALALARAGLVALLPVALLPVGLPVIGLVRPLRTWPATGHPSRHAAYLPSSSARS